MNLRELEEDLKVSTRVSARARPAAGLLGRTHVIARLMTFFTFTRRSMLKTDSRRHGSASGLDKRGRGRWVEWINQLRRVNLAPNCPHGVRVSNLYWPRSC
jgi:hypothetical protein